MVRIVVMVVSVVHIDVDRVLVIAHVIMIMTTVVIIFIRTASNTCGKRREDANQNELFHRGLQL